MNTAIRPQLEPVSLRVANWILGALGRAYPEDFQHVIKAARWACRSAYAQKKAFGVFVTLLGFLRELQFVLPQQYDYPNLLQVTLRAYAAARPAPRR